MLFRTGVDYKKAANDGCFQIIDKVCFFLESVAKVKRQPCRKSFLRTAQSAGTSTGRAKNFPAGSAVARFSKKWTPST